VAALIDQARLQRPRCVLVDLSFPGLDLPALLGELAGAGSPRVVAYGSHVDTATLRAARQAGCDPVLPRSKFVEDLPHELPIWLAGPGG
jgi:DNA-binding NarL/FixJ family response regulator